MKRVLWDFQSLVEQLSEEETLQRYSFLRIIDTENSLIRDQWASAMVYAFLPSLKLQHKNGLWHSFNSVKYMVLLSNTRLHLQTLLQEWTYSYSYTPEETTQTTCRDSSLLFIIFWLCHFITVKDLFYFFSFFPIFTNLQENHIYLKVFQENLWSSHKAAIISFCQILMPQKCHPFFSHLPINPSCYQLEIVSCECSQHHIKEEFSISDIISGSTVPQFCHFRDDSCLTMTKDCKIVLHVIESKDLTTLTLSRNETFGWGSNHAQEISSCWLFVNIIEKCTYSLTICKPNTL